MSKLLYVPNGTTYEVYNTVQGIYENFTNINSGEYLRDRLH